jgi:hypothetical protein
MVTMTCPPNQTYPYTSPNCSPTHSFFPLT